MQAVHEQIQAVTAAAGHGDLPDHAERLRHLVAGLPSDLWHKLSAAVGTKDHQFETRYGRATAVAIVAAGIVGTAVPLPFTSVLTAAPVIGLAELHHQVAPTLYAAREDVAAKAELAETE